MVSEAMRGKGLGRAMMRLPLIDTLVLQQPLAWDQPPRIVTHVLAGNDAPRRIIPAAGFRYDRPVEIPAEALPGLKADVDGIIRGDEFSLDVPAGLLGLADWCEGWTGKLLDGTDATVDLVDDLDLADWGTMLREIAAAHGASATGA